MTNELNVLLAAIQEAGEAIFKIQQRDFAIERKANNEIVTEADLLANEILKSALTQNFPDYGWLSEETVDDAKRLQCERVWVVDPIDGTKEYANRTPEYGISVALVEDGQPILAAVFNPATNELFHAQANKGAWLNHQKINCESTASEKKLLLASRSEYKRGEWRVFEDTYQVKQVGSIAYKLGLIAAGKAHGTFSLGPKNEWDIAAGTLIVAEANGIVTDKNKEKFQFNRSTSLVNGIVATCASFNNELFSYIAKVT